MEIIHDLQGSVPSEVSCAVTIGVYDGIHRGHQSVLAQVRSHAEEHNLSVAVVTFDVHPASVLSPDNAPKMLTSNEQRMELFSEQEVDYLYLVKFNEERADTDDQVFTEQVFAKSLNARKVVVGEDFHFGRGRSGNVDTLTVLGQDLGFDVEGLALLADDGATEPISSTAIRRVLAEGNVTEAAKMLGRNYEVRGVVSEGDQRGRTIGFPTANVPVDGRFAFPADGVYAGWCTLEDGSRHGCAINIGRRPTFHLHAEHSLLEAHLLDFEGDLYGQNVRIEFAQFLRSEHRFNGIDELVAQLRQDVDAVRSILDS